MTPAVKAKASPERPVESLIEGFDPFLKGLFESVESALLQLDSLQPFGSGASGLQQADFGS
jgi:hypothetical protein